MLPKRDDAGPCELAEEFPSAAKAMRQAFDYVEVFFDQKLLHSTLGYVSPAAFEQSLAA